MQGKWAEETGDWRAAVELWLAAGDAVRAVTIYGDRGWLDDLIELVRSMDKYDMVT